MPLRNCPICLESLKCNSLAVLTCGHCYHEMCLKRMIRARRDALCPLCGQQRITQCRLRLGSNPACMICLEGMLEEPSKPMEVIAPGRELVHSACLGLLRHSEPFKTSKNGSFYKLWGSKSIAIASHHRIYCSDEVTPAIEDDLLVYDGQKTFAEDVAQCVFELKKAEEANNDALAFVTLRKLRILASSCDQLELQSNDNPSQCLLDARHAVFLKQEAIRTALHILRKTPKMKNPALWRHTAEFLVEVCLGSFCNALFLLRSGGFENILVNANDAFLSSLVYTSLGHHNIDTEPPLVEADGIELVVDLMRQHQYAENGLKVQLHGVSILQHCAQFANRVFACGGIAILRRHANDARPSHSALKRQAIAALSRYGVYGLMLQDERIDFCKGLSEAYYYRA